MTVTNQDLLAALEQGQRATREAVQSAVDPIKEDMRGLKRSLDEIREWPAKRINDDDVDHIKASGLASRARQEDQRTYNLSKRQIKWGVLTVIMGTAVAEFGVQALHLLK